MGLIYRPRPRSRPIIQVQFRHRFRLVGIWFSQSLSFSSWFCVCRATDPRKPLLSHQVIRMDDDHVVKGDKLILRGLKFHGYHGVKSEERTLGQKFVIDVDAWMDLREAGKSDRLADTVSYTDIYRIVKGVVEGSPHNLLESVAHHIAATTFTKFPQISAVRVKVGKPHVAVQGQLDYLGVEIFRSRELDGQN